MKKLIISLLMLISFSAFAGLDEAKKMIDEKKYDEAEAEVKKELATNSRNRKATLMLMDIYRSQKKNTSYLKVVKNAVDNGQKFSYALLWNAANIAFSLRDHDKVIYFTKKCNAKSPNSHSVFNLMGVSYYYLNKYRLSVIALRAAVTFQKRQPVYAANLARSYEMMGNYEKAADYYKLSLKYDPKMRRSSRSLERVQNKIKSTRGQ